VAPQAPAAQQATYCRNCGAANSVGARFCRNCGQPLQ